MAKTAMRESSGKTLAQLKRQAANCRACPLWAHATQTVFGEGASGALIMLVGEQPGDKEDLAGKPFVGPAGTLLDQALADAGIDRSATYVTNAVKHFKWELRGKRRLHKTPAQQEILACRPWLEQELMTVKPKLVIALGATAARTLLGRATPVEANRGRRLHLPDGTPLRITVHPSYLLRIRGEQRSTEYTRFVSDLKGAAHDVQ